MLLIIIISIINLCINFNFSQQIGGSSCAIMNQKMYITGGIASSGRATTKYTNLITVALDKAFKVDEFALQDSPNVDISSLGSDAKIPNYGAIFGEGVNGTKLWMYGNDETNPLKYFDLSTGGINNNVKLDSPDNRNAFGWITHAGFFCMYGGRVTKTNELSNEYWRFNTSDLKWTNIPTRDDMLPLEYSQGVFLTQDRFVILGGRTADGTVRDLSEAYIYSFKSKSWSIQKLKNGENYPIVKFTPVAYNNKIIVQGGASNINSTFKDYKIYNDAMVLDTTTWEWRHIELKSENTNDTNNNYGRAGYSAWLVNNQLVQFLGEIDNSNDQQAQVIDLDTFLVAKEYRPPPQSWYAKAFAGNYDDKQDPDAPNLPLIIGLSVGAAVLLIIGIIIYIYYRKKVNRLEKELNVPEPFLEPIQPNLNPLWSENDGTNSNYRPNSSFTDKFNTKGSSNEKYNSNISDNTLNSSNRNSSFSNNRPLSTDNNSNSNNNNNNINENPLFVLRSDTIMPGENYMEAINEKFVS